MRRVAVVALWLSAMPASARADCYSTSECGGEAAVRFLALLVGAASARREPRMPSSGRRGERIAERVHSPALRLHLASWVGEPRAAREQRGDGDVGDSSEDDDRIDPLHDSDFVRIARPPLVLR